MRGGYFDIFQDAENYAIINGGQLNWNNLTQLSVDKAVIDSLNVDVKEYAKYYCHPAVLEANPRLLRYYRSIALFSLKGLKSISGVSAVEKIEEGEHCKDNQSFILSQVINKNLNLIYSSIGIDSERRKGLFYSTTGSSIEGSWRNAIGTEGERIINTMLLKLLLRNDEINCVINKKGYQFNSNEIDSVWIEKNTPDLLSATCKNGSIVKFGSEPDLSCFISSGELTAGVEVKAGLDPAGALERLGAMLKSFEHVLSQSPNAETLLVIACLTDTVQNRLNSTKNVSRVFILTDIINDPNGAGVKFCNILRSCLGLIPRYL